MTQTTRRRLTLLGVLVAVLGAFFVYQTFIATPSRQRLLAAAEGADRVVIRPAEMVMSSKYDVPAVEINGREKVAEFLGNVDWDGRSPHCKCDGQFHIELYKGEECVVRLGWQHGKAVRWREGARWYDLRLTPGARKDIPAWFVQHGFAAMQQQMDDGYMVSK